MPYRHKLDPKTDLVGATPETLAAAMFRNYDPALRPPQVGKSIPGGKVAEQEVAADHSGNNIPHLIESS